ncbi:DNA primase family protein [Leuconostoc mesenteroides]|uniref:DNA primase family protein n=1 Tax=Leuconostoc mesenteroides TaxID=1245 RepID=UPI00235E0334|nr:phage/plasmid primase, P4 family [Leuconostoc mesenteroides]
MEKIFEKIEHDTPDFVFVDANNNTKVNQLQVVEIVLKNTLYFNTLGNLSGFFYNGQYWETFKTRNEAYTALKFEISNILGDYASARLIKDILELTLSKALKNERRYVFETKPSLVSFKNTAVDGDTMEFIPNSPELYILGGFDFAIETDMNVGKTLNLFMETLGDNHKFMIEFFGSMFHRDYRPFQYAVIITGQAGAGKSYLVELMRAFIGKKMTTSLSLEQIAKDKFMTAEMYGSYANIKSDLKNNFIPDFETINNLTGQDSLQVQRKGENSFSFTNHAKLLFTANEAPAIKSNTGIRRRMKIVVAKSAPHVAKSDDDDNYTEFMKERGAFVYYAMSLYMEAKNRRKMSLTKDIEDATAEWFLKGDDIENWVNEHLIEDTNSRPRSNWLYNELKYYWAENGLEKVPSSKVVMARLRELGYDVRKNNATFPNIEDGDDKGQVAQRVIGVKFFT